MTIMMLLKSHDEDLQRITETNQMDKALKQRLVGAIVLIILAVIVLPMLLSGRSETIRQESRQIELPAKPDELSIETRRFPVGVPGKPATTTEQAAQEQTQAVGDQSNTGPASVTAQGSDSGQSQAPVAETDDNGVIEPAESGAGSPGRTVDQPPAVTSITLSSGRAKDVNIAQAAESSPDTPRYLVQVASFSSEKKANVLAETLRAKNMPVVMDVVDRTAGRMHRVRVGPYVERSEADAVVSNLSSEMKDLDLTPRVLDLKPGESAPVSAPSDPLVRWVVQVGSFNEAKRAEALVAQLRLSDLAAFSEKVTSEGGAVYKVRVGPEINRDKALELARKVKTEHQLDAFVTTLE